MLSAHHSQSLCRESLDANNLPLFAHCSLSWRWICALSPFYHPYRAPQYDYCNIIKYSLPPSVTAHADCTEDQLRSATYVQWRPTDRSASCPICLDDFSPGVAIARTTCLHDYHQDHYYDMMMSVPEEDAKCCICRRQLSRHGMRRRTEPATPSDEGRRRADSQRDTLRQVRDMESLVEAPWFTLGERDEEIDREYRAVNIEGMRPDVQRREELAAYQIVFLDGAYMPTSRNTIYTSSTTPTTSMILVCGIYATDRYYFWLDPTKTMVEAGVMWLRVVFGHTFYERPEDLSPFFVINDRVLEWDEAVSAVSAAS